MSTNILYVKVIQSEDCHFTAVDYDRLFDEVQERHLPENNFFTKLSDRRGRPLELHEGKVPIRKLAWNGEGSGSFFQKTLVEKLVPHIRGKLLAFAAWEGAHLEFWLIENGRLRTMELEGVLKEAAKEDTSFATLIAEIVAKKGR